MLRVRPGVELVFASFAPTSELITLDFPTFDRPRKATSGNAGAGKCIASVAASINRARTRMSQCAVRWGELASARVKLSPQSQWPLVFDVLFLDRPELVPEEKNSCHRQPNPHADEEKPSISWERNQQEGNHCQSDDQAGRTPQRSFESGMRRGLH